MEDASRVRRDQSGFTLVELVVVIAILGILAGVAYAGYGGYIEYAKRSGDEELISAVNLAFTTACEEQGIERTDLRYKSASLDYSDTETGSKIIGIDYLSQAVVGDPEAFKKLFNQYFDNEDQELKVYTKDDIIFSGSNLFSYIGNIDANTLNQELGRLVKDSNLATHKDELGKGLQNTKEVAKKALDKLKEHMKDSDLNDKLRQFASELEAKGYKFSVDNIGEQESYSDQLQNEIINALILDTAKNLSNSDPNSLMDKFNGLNFNAKFSTDNSKMNASILGLFNSEHMNNPESLISDLALSAGMASAYYNYCLDHPDNQQCKDWMALYKESFNTKNNGSNRLAALLQSASMIHDDTDYLSSYAQKDLSGLLGTFTAVDQNSDLYDIQKEDSLQKLLDDLLGQLTA